MAALLYRHALTLWLPVACLVKGIPAAKRSIELFVSYHFLP